MSYSGPAVKRRRTEPPLPALPGSSPPKPSASHILTIRIVARKLAGCLSAARLTVNTQGEAKPDSSLPPNRRWADWRLSWRLSLRLVSRAFGRTFEARRIASLIIEQSCHLDHVEHQHSGLAESAAVGWREALPSVKSLELGHVFYGDVVALLATKEAYPSLRRLRVDTSELVPYDVEDFQADYPSLRRFVWPHSSDDDREPGYFVAQLLDSLCRPDSMRRLHLYLLDLHEEDAEHVQDALERFTGLESLTGFLAAPCDVRVCQPFAHSLEEFVSYGGEASADLKPLVNLKRLRMEVDFSPVLRLPKAIKGEFHGAQLQKLFLKVELIPKDELGTLDWTGLAVAFPNLAVLQLVLGFWPLHEGDRSWTPELPWAALCLLIDGFRWLKALKLSLFKANSVRLRLTKAPLETLWLENGHEHGVTGPPAELRLSGATERTLRRLVVSREKQRVLWGEAQVDVAQSDALRSGRLQRLCRPDTHWRSTFDC